MSQDKKDKAAAADHLPSFKSLHQVLQHLKDAGYKIGKSKLYEDAKKGAIRINPDNSVLETEVRAYAGTLARVSGDIQDLNDVHSRKASKDVELTDIKIKRAQFELDREQGRYIERAMFEAELAARAAIFETGLKHYFSSKIQELVALVGGKPEKSPEFMQRINAVVDEELSRYATTKNFHVVFIGDHDATADV